MKNRTRLSDKWYSLRVSRCLVIVFGIHTRGKKRDRHLCACVLVADYSAAVWVADDDGTNARDRVGEPSDCGAVWRGVGGHGVSATLLLHSTHTHAHTHSRVSTYTCTHTHAQRARGEWLRQLRCGSGGVEGRCGVGRREEGKIIVGKRGKKQKRRELHIRLFIFLFRSCQCSDNVYPRVHGGGTISLAWCDVGMTFVTFPLYVHEIGVNFSSTRNDSFLIKNVCETKILAPLPTSQSWPRPRRVSSYVRMNIIASSFTLLVQPFRCIVCTCARSQCACTLCLCIISKWTSERLRVL